MKKKIVALLVLVIVVVGAYYAFLYINKNKNEGFHESIFSKQAYDTDLSSINTLDDFTLQLSSGNIKIFHITNINLNLETKELKLNTKYVNQADSYNVSEYGLWDNLFEEEKLRLIDVYGSKEVFLEQEQHFLFSLEDKKEFSTNTSYKDLNIFVVPNGSFYESNFYAAIEDENISNNLICILNKDVKEKSSFYYSCSTKSNLATNKEEVTHSNDNSST